MGLQDNKHRKWKNPNFISSFNVALEGIVTVFKEERNMKSHLVSAILVVILGVILRVSVVEWLFLLLSIALVITFEIVNSVIENVVDLSSHYKFCMLAKVIKDMAAGAVLIVSCFAIFTGFIIFVPKILNFIF